MIEFCSERRMFIAIGLLGGVTLLVLILEGRWTWSANAARVTVAPSTLPITATNTSCWLREEFVVLEECHPCSAFEVTSKSIKECIPTKYKEVLKCKVSGRAVRSCLKVVWLEERNFWLFELASFCVAFSSSLAVFIRQRQLDRRMIKRLQAQLSSCA
ncbi:protein JTB [Frankliniella occidentalis]|uniref:Protein JTB n=1 Tax=Frankliniella occidentalis TaxID=133901 RepID=A0A6J1S115_FRAOC|nr:protein JTB [Frankliniella occidentalis]